jgi:hypothetical protein
MTHEELLEKLKLICNKVDDFAYQQFSWDCIEDNPEYLKGKEAHDEWEKSNPQPSHDSKVWPSYRDWSKAVLDLWREKKQAELGEYADIYSFGEKLILESVGLGSIEEIDSYGGEGQGETWYRVYYFKDIDLYVRVDGFYQSYSGVSFNGWDDISIVRPVEKTVTVYE